MKTYLTLYEKRCYVSLKKIVASHLKLWIDLLQGP
jgi:hypothetical protein